MKKIYISLITLVILTASCADNKTFRVEDETSGLTEVIYAEPYGVFNKEDKDPRVEYKVCKGNVILSIIFSETLLVPVWLVGWELYEPKSLK